MSPRATSTRWCPTPKQLMILEELYRRGLKTPKASQIQKITAHLALYGKIQGKNVFYWFQNHKARDRQKLRKKLVLSKQLQQHHHQQQLIMQHDEQYLYGAQLYQQYHHHNRTSHHHVSQYNISHNNDVNNVLDFQCPPPAFVQFSNCNSAHQNLHPQDTGVVYDQKAQPAEATVTKQTWVMEDLARDCLNITSYGHHDSMMINMDAGPTFPCCSSSNRNRPLQTLELFPLRSPKSTTGVAGKP